jgi:hypothetical protein
MLQRVRDDVLERVAYDPDILAGDAWDGMAHEIADSAPSPYTYQSWRETVDLGAYGMFDDPDTSDAARDALAQGESYRLPMLAAYHVAYQLAHALTYQLAHAAADDRGAYCPDRG